MFIGIDIGGTKCAVSYGDETGNIRKKIRFKTEGVAETLQKIWACKADLGAAEAVGISCGGLLDTEKGLILSPPNLSGWDNVPITALAEEHFGAPAGTGLGAGMILNGKLYRGANGMVGEAGHMRLSDCGSVGYGKSGSFEGFCSGSGIAQLGMLYAKEAYQMGKSVSYCASLEQISSISAKHIADCAKGGNADAAAVYEACGAYLGKGLSVVIDILNPERIVLGSIFARSGELLIPSMQRVLEKECLPAALKACTIVPAMLGEQIGDYAALAVALEGVRKQ